MFGFWRIAYPIYRRDNQSFAVQCVEDAAGHFSRILHPYIEEVTAKILVDFPL